MQETKLIQACSDRPEFIAEVKMDNLPDLANLCELMKNSRFFESITYLSNAGILRARCGDKSIMVFRNGRVTINCVRDKEESSKFVGFLLRVLIP